MIIPRDAFLQAAKKLTAAKPATTQSTVGAAPLGGIDPSKATGFTIPAIDPSLLRGMVDSGPIGGVARSAAGTAGSLLRGLPTTTARPNHSLSDLLNRSRFMGGSNSVVARPGALEDLQRQHSMLTRFRGY